MPIQRGEHPQGFGRDEAKANKFLGSSGEGHRGILLAVSEDRKRGVVLALTQSVTPGDGVAWGNLYHIVERDPTQWPVVDVRLDHIPQGFQVLLEEGAPK